MLGILPDLIQWCLYLRIIYTCVHVSVYASLYVCTLLLNYLYMYVFINDLGE